MPPLGLDYIGVVGELDAWAAAQASSRQTAKINVGLVVKALRELRRLQALEQTMRAPSDVSRLQQQLLDVDELLDDIVEFLDGTDESIRAEALNLLARYARHRRERP